MLIVPKIKIRQLLFEIYDLSFKIVCLSFEWFEYHIINRSKIKYIRICFTNFWRNFGGIQKDWFLKPLEKIFRGNNKNFKCVKFYKPDIHIFNVFGKKKNIIKSRAKCKIFYTSENVDFFKWIKPYKDYCIENVDLSFGALLNPEGIWKEVSHKYMQLPVWIRSIFPPDSSKDDIKKILEQFEQKYKKTKFCALIARHDMANIRIPIYNQISTIGWVDCPSKLMHNDDTLKKDFKDNKKRYLQQYKFNICPENSLTPGVLDEKLFDALAAGCIPIYTGWSNNPEPYIVNPKIILWYDPASENIELLREIKKMNKNDRIYNSFMAQKYFVDTAVDKIYEYIQIYYNKLETVIKKCLI